MPNYCYVSCISNMKYMPGVMALAYSLEKTKPNYPFKVMIPENTDPAIAEALSGRGIESFTMPQLHFDAEELQDNRVGYWTESLFKLNLFRLRGYSKIVYLDADMIVINNIDDLFERPHMSGVIAGQSLYPAWDGLNSGMMVIVPGTQGDFEGLMKIAPSVIRLCREKQHGFGDQNVINHYFTEWKNHGELHLPETYNALYGMGITPFQKSIVKQYGIPIEEFQILHFIGSRKPWNRGVMWKLGYLLRLMIQRDGVEYKAWRMYADILKQSK